MTEKKIEAHLVDAVKQLGGIALKYPASFFNGFPDRIVLLPVGRVAFIELKRPGAKPRPLQWTVQNKLRNLGFFAETADSIEAVDKIINDLITKYGV